MSEVSLEKTVENLKALLVKSNEQEKGMHQVILAHKQLVDEMTQSVLNCRSNYLMLQEAFKSLVGEKKVADLEIEDYKKQIAMQTLKKYVALNSHNHKDT